MEIAAVFAIATAMIFATAGAFGPPVPPEERLRRRRLRRLRRSRAADAAVFSLWHARMP